MRLTTALALLVTNAFAACGGGDSSSTSPGQSGTMSLGVSPATVSVAVGGTATLTVTITRGGGFSGGVTLLMEGVPPGVTVTFSPATLTGSATSSTMTVTAAGAAAPGRYLMTVRATATGMDEAGYQVWLDVVQPFALKMARDTLRLVQGDSASLDVSVTRGGGFTGGVTLTLEGAPAGVSGALAPNPVGADRSTLSLKVGASVPAGKYPLMVKGTAADVPAQSASFVLEVLAGAAAGFTLAISPAAVTVVSGNSASATVTVRRTGGFAGAVSLSAQGQPAGVACAFTPPTVSDSVATLTFTAALALTGGTYTLAVTGKAAGQPDRQATLQLTVQEIAGFWVTLSSGSISTAPGGAPQTITVQITRTGGFSDTVRLAMTGLPAGLTATFNPAATTANATLTIAAAPTASAGTYTGTLHATATGQLERTTTLSLSVVAASTNIVWRFCAPVPRPVFMAVQDGVSPYAAVSPSADGSYVTGVAAGKGAVVLVLPGLPDTAGLATARVGAAPAQRARPAAASSAGYTTYMYYGSAGELQQVAQAQCPASAAPRTVSGSLAGVPSTAAWTVALDGVSAVGLPGGGNAFTLANVLAGARDLVAARAPAADNQILADALIIRRGLDPADGSTLAPLDFASAESFAPASGTLTVSGIPAGDSTEVVLGFLTANGTNALVGQLSSVTSATRAISGIPNDRLRTGDLHSATATAESVNPPLDLSATLYAAHVGTWQVSIAAAPALPSADVYATTPVVRLRARGSLGAQGGAYGGMVHVSFVQAAAQRATVVYLSRAYLGSTGSFEIRTGGYNTLSGWSESSYGLQPGALTDFVVELLTGGYAPSVVDGTVLHSMRSSGQLRP